MTDTLTVEEAERRTAARAAGLPLTASWADIWAQRGGLPLETALRAQSHVEREERDARKLEKATQAEVTRLFRSFGCKVYSLSQPRATKQTPGIPDLWVTHAARGVAFWWETKREVGGKLSPAQVDFAHECSASRVRWGTGDRHDAEDYLIELGWAERGPAGVLEPLRRRV